MKIELELPDVLTGHQYYTSEDKFVAQLAAIMLPEAAARAFRILWGGALCGPANPPASDGMENETSPSTGEKE